MFVKHGTVSTDSLMQRPAHHHSPLLNLETQSSKPFLHFSNPIPVHLNVASRSDSDRFVSRRKTKDCTKLRNKCLPISCHFANDSGMFRSMDSVVRIHRKKSNAPIGFACRASHRERVLRKLESLLGRWRRRPSVGKNVPGIVDFGVFPFGYHSRLLNHIIAGKYSAARGMVLE